MGFEFRCHGCGEIHKGMPGLGAEAPLSYYAIPKPERASRCALGRNDCVIDHTSFFVRGCLEIPVHDADEPLIWGVWVSLSEQSFRAWLKVFEQEHRSHVGPFFWLAERLAQALPGNDGFEDTGPSSRPRSSAIHRA